jgi:hypothetical protein
MEKFGFSSEESRNKAIKRYKKRGYDVYGVGRSPVSGYGFYIDKKR